MVSDTHAPREFGSVGLLPAEFPDQNIMHVFELGVVGDTLTSADRVQGFQAAQQEGGVQVTLDLVAVAEHLGALVERCFLVGIVGVVVTMHSSALRPR